MPNFEEVEVEELQAILAVDHHPAPTEKAILKEPAQIVGAAQRRELEKRHLPTLGIDEFAADTKPEHLPTRERRSEVARIENIARELELTSEPPIHALRLRRKAPTPGRASDVVAVVIDDGDRKRVRTTAGDSRQMRELIHGGRRAVLESPAPDSGFIDAAGHRQHQS